MSSKPGSEQDGLATGKLSANNKLVHDKSSQLERLDDHVADGRAADPDATAAAEAQPHYQWPPPRDPNLVKGKTSRNPVHTLITALPLIMLMTGFYIYYRGESEQKQSMPIQSESVRMSGIFTGMSATSGRHYLWIQQAGEAKGIRVREEQFIVLDDLVRGELVELQAAPSVHESTTYWALQVEQSGKTFLDVPDASADP